ncbi:MAG: CRISPR-associated endonuclease Cas2 [Candidatus Methanoperedens sp.]|uniref:CRISPR-associated endonuclease Cas2 n=1 Tax=Candidatus Methanoperedens nitratireducens TaxID=1392998 RepID=UPI00064E447F|nr:CRISPR-associated endonuclease Cas2 [Candidatus Methanoperedens nitroreducens]MDJ1422549.1 CRISPR-associated endonuclease Cas2 [Candidatus Methanoperedens sp.]
MYVVIVYDVGVERVNKVRIYLKQYLNWVQNSVFEGELTESEYMRIMNRLKEIIDESLDHVICYKSRDKRYLDIDEAGTRKAEISTII